MPYSSTHRTERSIDDDGHRRQDQQAQSPTHGLPYSPINGTHPKSPYDQYASRPSISPTMSHRAVMSPSLGPPPSPRSRAPPQNGTTYPDQGSGRSTRYDPISEHRDGQSSWNHSPYQTRSPKHVSFCGFLAMLFGSIYHSKSANVLHRRQERLPLTPAISLNQLFLPWPINLP